MLRFIGIANAAAWFGAALFFTFVVGPGIFSPEMYRLFGGSGAGDGAARFWVGSIAQVLLQRYYSAHLIFGAIAMVHLVLEWLYTGRPLRRVLFLVSLGLFSLGLAGGYWLQPKMRQLHATMYGGNGPVTVAQAAKARSTFNAWHGVAQATNLVVLAGLAFYLWQLTQPVTAPRFVSQTKFHLE